MLDSSGFLPLASHLPVLFDGAGLHRAALAAAARGRSSEADALFERAAARYRARGLVEPIARLRAHQLIVAIRGGRVADGARAACVLEVERRLSRLLRIEALEAPFALVDARELLATWLPESETRVRPAA